MAIKFHKNIRSLVMNRGILAAGYDLPTAISIYSGAHPSAIDIVNNWVNYNATKTNFLAHYTGAVWAYATSASADFCSIVTMPDPVIPVNPGTGEWCILWTTNPTLADMALETMPADQFLVCSVTTLVTAGVIRFNPDTVFVSGELKEITDGMVSITST
jgi:hypothetical protein